MSIDSVHALRVEVARLTRERDDFKALNERSLERLYEAQESLAAARRECEGLRKALTALLHEVEESGNGDARDFGWGHALKLTRAALAAPATAPGEETER